MTGLKKLLMWKASGGAGPVTPLVEATASGNPATFVTDVARPLKACTVSFSPVQEGSGDPSPENVRPISGWDRISLFVSETDTGGTEYPVTWQEAGTVYAGTLDAVNGLLTLTHKSATINETTQFDFRDSGRYVVFEQPDMLSGSHYTDANTLCDKVAKVANVADAPSDVLAVLIGSNNKRLYFYHFNTALNITTASAFTEWIAQNPITYTYPLATPVTYQVSRKSIRTLIGTNNVRSDANGSIELTYLKKA